MLIIIIINSNLLIRSDEVIGKNGPAITTQLQNHAKIIQQQKTSALKENFPINFD